MNVKSHLISTVPLSTGYYFIGGDIMSVSLAVLSTILVDIDHFLDYVITQRRIDSPKKMMGSFNTLDVVRKNYFILHSWEIITLFIITLFFYPSPSLIAIFTGYTFHLLLDQIFNVHLSGKYNVKNYYYFFFYRMSFNFDVLPLREKGLVIRAEDKIS
tara:strand:+ start:44 stop:517 length:474 start_codon:yes stop_codon:yes gene_type:complete